MLKELHQNRPGVLQMKLLRRTHIWFPNIDHKIESIVKLCQNCKKISNEPNKSQPHPWSLPANPIDRRHIDYFEYNKFS